MSARPERRRRGALVAATALLLASLPAACQLRCGVQEKIQALPADPAEQASAVVSAEEFLAALDRGAAAAIYPELSSVLREASSETTFQALVGTIRGTAGATISRRLIGAAYTEKLPDVRPGRYFVLEFETKFSKRTLKERVVPRFEDGRWKVAGYHAFGNFKLVGD